MRPLQPPARQLSGRAQPCRGCRALPFRPTPRGGWHRRRCSGSTRRPTGHTGQGRAPKYAPGSRPRGSGSSWRLGGGGHVCLGAHDIRQGRNLRVPLKPLVPQRRYPRGGSIWGPMLSVRKPGPTPLLGLRLGAWRGPAHLICATRGLHCQPWLYVYIGAPITLRAPIRAPRRSPRDTGARGRGASAPAPLKRAGGRHN
jgi:hypothetical protein